MRLAALFVALALLAGCGGQARTFKHRAIPNTAWRSVINDWYDGKIDHRHSCAAVREAIRHLPGEGGDSYSTVKEDLDAYAKRVC
jgi:hypothetical protein